MAITLSFHHGISPAPLIGFGLHRGFLDSAALCSERLTFGIPAPRGKMRSFFREIMGHTEAVVMTAGNGDDRIDHGRSQTTATDFDDIAPLCSK